MDLMKYLSGMLDFNANPDYIDEQEFADNGMPIPIGAYRVPVGELEAKSMPVRMRDEEVHEAAAIAEQLKAAWLQGAKNFLGGSGMLNSKRDLRPEEKQNQSIEVAPSKKPGWMLPRDADGNINGNYWSVNTDDAYWDTEEGYQEALELYGTSPAWSSKPMEQENNFVDLQPTKRISL